MSLCCGAGVASLEFDRGWGFAGRRITKSGMESTCPAGFWLACTTGIAAAIAKATRAGGTDSGCAEEQWSFITRKRGVKRPSSFKGADQTVAPRALLT